MQAHSSAFLPVSDAGRPLMFHGDADRERTLALQALAQLGTHRLASFPGIFLRGLELPGGREAAGEDLGRPHAPAAPRDRWAEEAGEEGGEEEAEEGE